MANERIEVIIDWIPHQKCCRCGELKPLNCFSVSNWRPHTVCRECKAIYDKAYREKNKEIIARKNKIYREIHRDELHKKAKEKYRADSKKYIDRSNEYRRRKVKENWFAREAFHEQARKAVKKSNIVFDSCFRCDKDGKIELHHPSYDDRDMRKYVVPLCRDCHRYVEKNPLDCPLPINLEKLNELDLNK